LPLTEVQEERAFQDWLEPQFVPKGPSKVLRYYWLWFVLVLVHWYIFFGLTNQAKVCDVPYCNPFNQNPSLIVFYLIFCFYFGLTAC
jgi:hypothetical protein